MATLYPPTVAASQPAFSPVSLYTLNFKMPELVSVSDIGHVQVKITYQSNSASAVNTSKYPDGIIYKKTSEVNFTDGTLIINQNELDGGDWKLDTYYKVQIRFGASSNLKWLDSPEDLKSFFNWKTEQINNNTTTYQTFGEWSTIMVLKCISKPIIAITSEQVTGSGGVQFDSTMRAVDTIMPLFSGRYACQSNEPIDKYRFQIYKGQSTQEEDLYLDTGWLQHDSTKDNLLLDQAWLQANQIEEEIDTAKVTSIDEHRFKQALDEGGRYTLIYSVITKNGYQGSSKPDYFEVILSRLNRLTGMSIEVYDHLSPIANEEGCMVIAINYDGKTTGNFVIVRTDEYSNYKYWEDICYFVTVDSKETVYKTDYTIESGIKYKYGLVKENSFGFRSIPLMEKNEPARWANFQYDYLLSEKGHIRIKYDSNIQSLKKNVLQNKQDTIGGKYPVITKNGYSYYSSFQLEGLITVEQEMDEYIDADSFKFVAGDYLVGADKICFSAYSKDNYWQRAKDRPQEEGTVYVYNINNLDNLNNLENDYYFVERKYREVIIDFLSDGKYKLYKSPTEGNMLVVLSEVSLTPKEELGRLVYTFSATANEVDEATLENLNEFNLIDIGEFQEQVGDTETLVGQVSGLFLENEDIMQAIVEDCHRQIESSDYEHQFKNLKAISIDVYPKTNFKEQVSIYQNEIKQYQTQLETEELPEYKYLRIQNKIEVLQAECNRLEQLQEAIESNVAQPPVRMSIDGNEIRIKSNRTYNLDGFTMTSGHKIYTLPFEVGGSKYYTPILVNYTARVIATEALARTVVKKDALTVWGQIGGAFETNKTILNNYNHLRNKTDLRVYNESVPTDDESNIYDAQHQMNYILIQSNNILETIQQVCRLRVEKIYGTTFKNYDEDNDTYDDGTRYYAFEHISKLDIEADEGTKLYIRTGDGEERIVRIGATERYVLNDLRLDDIKGIRFEDNFKNFALVNYTCKISVTTMGAASSTVG